MFNNQMPNNNFLNNTMMPNQNQMVNNNPMLQHYQNLINQMQQQTTNPQQQAPQDPKMQEIMEEYKGIPSVADKIKKFDSLKSELQNLEYDINKGFDNYYKAKTDPQYSQITEIKTMLEQLLNKNGGTENGRNVSTE